MSLFTHLHDERIALEIGLARKSVIFVAPGASYKVAESLVEAACRLGNSAVQVVLDVSANVARIGYGDHKAVELFAKSGLELRQHPGLRTGVLICDELGWSFSATPRLVESEVPEDASAFNAIELTKEQIQLLMAELPPVSVDESAGFQTQMFMPTVGADVVDRGDVARITTALEIAPPQSFDLARQTRVYTALIEFVELSFTGFNLQSRRVQLPKSLPMIASKDRNLKDRISASLKVLDQVEKPKKLKDITDALEELRSAYLIPVGHAGRIMLKSKRNVFESELASLEEQLDACKADLINDLQKALDGVVESITPELARAVLTDPPAQFRGVFDMTDAAARDYVTRELTKTFPDAASLVANMKIHKFFKDVTYETLKNKEFIERVCEVIPASVLDGALLNEDIAASVRSKI